ncbi:MAG: ShlB/FhaC/HecB family hemolysin secretion/activation protein [Sphingomonadales bacterium]|nr:MAG: ShlB/FhaC/HecB family hemolysin secretion/activation protein [Sphingomonadales bacterium]
MLLAVTLLAFGQDGAVLIDRNRIDRPRAPVAAPAPAPKRAKTRVAAPSGAAVTIRGIRFEGAEAPGPVAQAAQAFLGRTADTETLTELAAMLSNAYEKSDVALYTVAIPEQDYAEGTVRVLLTEGRIARAEVKGSAGKHRLLRARTAKMTRETPLSRATFERQFSLIRAIPGLTVEPAFDDPGADGALTLTLTPTQKRSKISAGFSNRGIQTLGDGQLDVKADFYGLGVDGDQLGLAASAASDLKRYRYASLAYQAPLTSSGLAVGLNAAYLDTRPRGTPIRGSAVLGGATLSYPLIRSFRRAADLSVGVDAINSDNAAFGALIARERTRAARVAASYSDNGERRSLVVAASLSQGLDILGARVIAPFAETRFRKANASASAAQAIGKRTTVRVNLTGQYSGDRLPAAERYSVGGEAIGRAFDTSLITADRGAGALGELAFRPVRGDTFGTSEFYVFADRAWIGIQGRGVPGRFDTALASAGVGGRLRWRDKAELGLELARVIDDPWPGYDEDWRMSVAWRLSL